MSLWGFLCGYLQGKGILTTFWLIGKHEMQAAR